MRQIAWLMAFALAGCVYMPPERIDRDSRVLEAVKPCRDQYRYFFTSDNRTSVNRDGTLRYWYHGHLVGTVPEVERCLADARKDLKIGPWAPASVARPGPQVRRPFPRLPRSSRRSSRFA
jgi:hypothetical protein